jgi:hypothetical protein
VSEIKVTVSIPTTVQCQLAPSQIVNFLLSDGWQVDTDRSPHFEPHTVLVRDGFQVIVPASGDKDYPLAEHLVRVIGWIANWYEVTPFDVYHRIVGENRDVTTHQDAESSVSK